MLCPGLDHTCMGKLDKEYGQRGPLGIWLGPST